MKDCTCKYWYDPNIKLFTTEINMDHRDLIFEPFYFKHIRNIKVSNHSSLLLN